MHSFSHPLPHSALFSHSELGTPLRGSKLRNFALFLPILFPTQHSALSTQHLEKHLEKH
uniref:Uncharacterized protein n=1 Tax=Desertifilum tharense IPPAS B-1220 TaxID=1781255 RepID=A0ACD5GUB7_9CYAN